MENKCGCPAGDSIHTIIGIYDKVLEIAKEYEILKDRWNKKDEQAKTVISDVTDNNPRLLEIMRLCVFELEWYENAKRERNK